MKIPRTHVAILLGFWFAGSALSLPAQNAPNRIPILVELFTSEGCSSCPAADALLAKLDGSTNPRVEIVALGEHVDYWDQLGWHDRFSSHLLTQRQNDYSSHFNLSDVYTPQMVVDGSSQFVGNDTAKAVAAINRAAAQPKLGLALAAPTLDGRRLASTVTLSAPGSGAGSVYAALVQPHASTDVRSGENHGRHLDHAAVVRSLIRIGSLKDASRGPIAFQLTAPADADPTTLRLVVFAQSETLGSGLGAVLAIASSSPRPDRPLQAAR
jgi:hypothetical protein